MAPLEQYVSEWGRDGAVVTRFGSRGLRFESRGLDIFSALDNVSARSEERVQRYIVISPVVRQFQPTPAGFTATHNYSGVGGFPPAVLPAAVR